MNLKQALAQAGERLVPLKDIDAPTFEAEVILRHCLNLDRAALHLNLKQELTAGQFTRFWGLIERRYQGEPASYIIGQREFFGLDFYVDRRVLIPRPETELLVEEALKFTKNHPLQSIADIGTGSGVIAVSLAVSLYQTEKSSRWPRENKGRANTGGSLAGIRIFASDISPDALEVARFNARKHSVEQHITFVQGDLLDSLPPSVDLIIANLPYVSAAEVKQMPSALFEPHLALDGGESGLDQIYRLAGQLKGRVNPGGCVLLEVGMGQPAAVKEYLKQIIPAAVMEVLPDLAGIERVVKVCFC